MKDWQIDYFLSVAHNSSFTAAANELNISQPAISRQITALEDEFGVTLIDRTKRSVTLTPAGTIFYEFFNDFRIKFLETKKKAKACNGEVFGAIHMGYPEGWNLSSFYPDIIERFNNYYPNIKLSYEGKGFPDLLAGLKNGLLDVIMSPDVVLRENADFSVQEITEIPHVLFYSSSLLPADMDNPVLSDFRDYTFFAPMFNRVVDYIKEHCAPFGFEPKIELVPNMETAIFAVQNKMGVAVGDSWHREISNQSFRYINMDSKHTISIAWLKNSSNPSILVFVNELIVIFSKMKE
jgi:DNA-binding transcriptional LysR family regulator